MPTDDAPTTRQLFQGRLLMMVEDHEQVRELMHRTFKTLGFEVTVANDADVALELLKQGNVPEILMTDVRLPGSLTGIELAERVSAEYPEVKIVLSSGDHVADVPARFPMLGKPYRYQQLVDLLKSVIDPS